MALTPADALGASEERLAHRVLRQAWMIDDQTGPKRERAIEHVPSIFRAAARPATPPATAPAASGWRSNAIADHLDYGRRYTTRTNHVQRSFEDTR